ncbi:MAG: PQQ-binding-like beta-propeller repeat protein [Phycisphaerales bacterium]|nr:PQQ-binding-like beta-propeller repeat protein [Phycisphaerales bacterium]
MNPVNTISITRNWKRSLVIFIGLLLAGPAIVRAEGWPHYAGHSTRNAVAMEAPPQLSAILWLADQDLLGNPIEFEGPSSPVVHDGRVFVNAKHIENNLHTKNKMVALDAMTGQWLWETIVDKPLFEFWSAPAVDLLNNAVLLGTGANLYSIDAMTGTPNWTAPLDRSIVNSSPVIPPDLNPGRAFVTDYDGFGTSASLYCVNTSPFNAMDNPYQPGDIVWQEPIGGSSGNSPAFHDGVIYVASSRGLSDSNGQIYAFDIDAAPADRLLWQWSLPTAEGFFGGVVHHNGFVYAASYNFNGSGENSTLVKIRASDGTEQWTIPCERTNTMPVINGNKIYLAAGVQGFGSVPKVQAFEDQIHSALKLWDTFVDTGGTLIIGGWTHQPILDGNVLYIGKIPPNPLSFDAYTDLFLLDVTRSPADPEFVIDHLAGMGSSPAASDGRLYTVGPGGLYAIAARGDFCADGLVNGNDIACFLDALLSGTPSESEIELGDFDEDGVLTTMDMPGFIDQMLE